MEAKSSVDRQESKKRQDDMGVVATHGATEP